MQPTEARSLAVSEDNLLSQERAAQNQALFRNINERVEEMNRTLEQLTPYATWVCECANLNCLESVELTLGEYEAVRARAHRFVVKPDARHLVPSVERVVEETDRYWLVEKVEQAAAVAVELDPRGE